MSGFCQLYRQMPRSLHFLNESRSKLKYGNLGIPVVIVVPRFCKVLENVHKNGIYRCSWEINFQINLSRLVVEFYLKLD